MKQPAQRYPSIDIARGIALGAMAIYHFAWDLRFFGLIQTDVVRHPLWSLFATPNSYIFFGILHSIALGSVLALPFLRLPLLLIAGSAILVLALPKLISEPFLNHWSLQWLGLGQAIPLTNDFIPVFPWFGFILVGLIAGRLLSQIGHGKPAPKDNTQLATRLLANAGRHSLAVYLLHQPVLIGLVAAFSFVVSPAGYVAARPDATTLEFRTFCTDSCMKSGGTQERCLRYCACAERDVKLANLWTPLLSNALSEHQRGNLKTITDQCTAATSE